MKVTIGLVVTVKVRDTEDKKREGRSRRMRRKVVGCVQAVVGKKNFSIKLEDRQEKGVSSCFLTVILSEEEVGKKGEDSNYDLPIKGECE